MEPYLGLGYVTSDAELVGNVQTVLPYSIFDGGGTSRSLKESSLRILAGVQAQLPMFKLSFEYTRVFDINRFSAKMGLAF